MTDQTDDLDLRAARLPREVRPDRDLWPAIEAGIAAGTQRAPGAPRGLTLATRLAAAVALMAMSSLGTWVLMGGRDDPAAGRMADRSFGAHYVLGPEFVKARDDLVARVDASLEHLSPETRTVVQGNLVEIRRSIAAINEALEAEPSNASLQQLLYSTYQQELSVMREISRLDQLGAEGVSI